MRPRRRSRSLVALLLALAFGCATGAASIREQADAALEKGDQEGAYRHLASLYRQHPDSDAAREAFPLAARILKYQYVRHRYADPDSAWVTSEPEFLFGWLAHYAGDAFPSDEAAVLFRGMHQGFAMRFVEWSKQAPQLARWSYRVEEDNGKVQSFTATPVAAAAP
jgi:hypothetical protein